MVIVPTLIALAVGLVAGLVRGGRLDALSGLRLRALPLLVVALVAGTVVDLVDVPRPGWWALVGLVAGLAFVVANLRLVGMTVVAVGLVVNLVPVLVEGATPVRGDALVAAGIVDAGQLDRVELRGARVLADDDTRLEILGDVIPVPALHQVLSFGDLIVLVGLADVVANALRRRRPRRLPRGGAASLRAFGWYEPDPHADLAASFRAGPGPLWGLSPSGTGATPPPDPDEAVVPRPAGVPGRRGPGRHAAPGRPGQPLRPRPVH
ncbi:MAG: hypothetical protein D6683_10610, partial [Actinomyces sp.]